MSIIRAVVRLILIFIATISFYILFLPALLFPFFGFSKLPWRNKIWTWWGTCCARLTGMKFSSEGTPPKPPFFLVSNHLSYVDIFLLYCYLKCTFVAKKEVRHWPVIGYMMESMGIIFVDRTRRTDVKRVNENIERNLNKHQGIVLFPEGTTSDGTDVLPFKASLLALPAEKQIPVSYATISYKTPEGEKHASRSVCWWGDMTFFKHLLQLLRMKKYYAHVRFADQTVIDSNRKRIAVKLHQNVKTQYLSEIEEQTHA